MSDAPPIPVLFEDESILVVAKPTGIAAIPERDPTIASVAKALEALRGEGLFVVHRLDKEVSGVMVFARTAAAHRTLCMAFERRQVTKSYLAVVHGILAADRQGPFTIDAPIHQFGSGRMGVDRRGKPSTTVVEALERRDTTTLVEARPITGRRHQIRVHLYSVGHPIVGDTRYGDPVLQTEQPRLMLHAWRLALPGWPRPFEAPPDPSISARTPKG